MECVTETIRRIMSRPRMHVEPEPEQPHLPAMRRDRMGAPTGCYGGTRVREPLPMPVPA